LKELIPLLTKKIVKSMQQIEELREEVKTQLLAVIDVFMRDASTSKIIRFTF